MASAQDVHEVKLAINAAFADDDFADDDFEANDENTDDGEGAL